MKTNVCHPMAHPLFVPLVRWWWGVAAYRWSLCLCVCPQTLLLTSPFCHTHPLQIPHSTPSGALYHDVVSFIRGGLFPNSCGMFTLIWDHVALEPWESEGVQFICWHCNNSFRCFGSWLAENTFRCRCYGLCVDGAQAMRQVQPLAWLKQWQRGASG